MLVCAKMTQFLDYKFGNDSWWWLWGGKWPKCRSHLVWSSLLPNKISNCISKREPMKLSSRELTNILTEMIVFRGGWIKTKFIKLSSILTMIPMNLRFWRAFLHEWEWFSREWLQNICGVIADSNFFLLSLRFSCSSLKMSLFYNRPLTLVTILSTSKQT